MGRIDLVFMGITSGVVSSLGVFLSLNTLAWLPGVVYGLLVAIPWSLECRLHPLQICAIAVLSVVGYFVAVWIAMISGYLLSPLAGAIGATIMLLPTFRPVWDSIRRAVLMTVLAGALSGVVFVLSSFVKEGWWGLILGIAIWQAVTAYTLSFALPIGEGSTRPLQL